MWGRAKYSQKQPKNTKNAFFDCFWAYVGQPHDHIRWDTSMPFPSINATNPRTNLYNFCKKNLRIGDFEKHSFFELAILDLFFSKFFASFVWKSANGSWISRMGQNFDDYPDFQPKITHPKHFSRHCIYKFFPVFFFKSNNFGLRDRQLHLQGLERYFAVCHLKKMNSKTAFIILGSIVPLSITMHLPVAWWFEWHINDNGTVVMVSNSEFILDSKFYIPYSREH